ncbi:MAG: hypothetical protein QOD84_1495, partial [Acidobacteriaceae bacterium]
MRSHRSSSQGFTLIASLLLLLILSGVAIGLLMMVNTEGRASGNDQQNTKAYRAAEGAIEKMTSDLGNTFQQIQAPVASDITSLSTLVPPPDSTGVVYVDYTLTPSTKPNGTLNTTYSQVKTGSYQGLSALTVPITLKATALEPLGQEVSMLRTVEVALIPVFQFGVFSESDLGFFSSPDLDFQGRVHTNGDLFLGVSNGSTLTFHDKITTYGNVIRKVLPNGLTASSYNDSGTVNILTTSQGCDGAQPGCRAIGLNEGSVTGAGGNPPQSGYNSGPPSWQTISQTSYNGWITNGNYGNAINTGVKQLTLPFVNGAATTNPSNTLAQPFEIIRQPPAGEGITSSLGTSRLYNDAEIRVLLADTPAELPGGIADSQNIRLSNGQYNSGPDYSHGVTAGVPAAMPALPGGHFYTTYFAEGSTAIPDPTTWNSGVSNLSPDWPFQPSNPPLAAVTLVPNPSSSPSSPLYAPLLSNATGAIPNTISVCTAPACKNNYPYYTPPAAANTSKWNLIDGYLRVEVLVNGNFVPVTDKWLQLGFARGVSSPSAPGTNPVNPNAILLLQQIADRNNDGIVDKLGSPATCGIVSCTSSGKPPEVQIDASSNQPYYGDSQQATSVSRNNWYPINIYDAREGEPRDQKQGNNSCTPNGVMNIVEVDVGNLRRWLNNDPIGTTIDWNPQNGYILYFSDRRGMLPSPNGSQVHLAGTKTGDSGLEDIINSSSAPGAPNGALEPRPLGRNQSSEDVNNNGLLDNFGTTNLGEGFGFIGAATVNSTVNANALKSFARMNSCLNSARPNWVSGARHALKLVDASLGNVPTKPDGTGGFTVGSENPVYVAGDYNSSAADPMWLNPAGVEPPHAAAAIIADAVTLLSNSWSDLRSFNNP